MANVLQTLAQLSRDASIMLGHESVMAPLLRGTVEQDFVERGKNSGGTIRITYVPKQTAQTVDHTSSAVGVAATDIDEYYVDVSALHYVAVKHTLTSKQLTYEVDDFAAKVTRPAIQGLAEAVDERVALQMARGAGAATGTVANDPSTLAHLTAARAAFRNNGVPLNGALGFLGPTAEASYLGVAQFTSGDYGDERPTALREARLGRLLGIDWFASANGVGDTVADGDVAGTVLVNAAHTASPSQVTLATDGYTNAAGDINAGAKFTIAGDSTEYVVTTTVTKASNAATLAIRPALQADAADNAAITFVGDVKANMLVQPGGVAVGVVAPAPLAVNSMVAPVRGMGVRITVESSTGDASTAPGDTIEFATYVAAEVVQPTCVEIIAG